MKRRFWIGGVLLLMFFTGMTGCGGPKEPPPEHMLDGPDMMYTPEDQTPYAGTWQSRDGTIVMKVERGGGAESESDMSLSVNGEPEFEAKLWVYSTGHVELLRGKEKVTISGTFCNLRFSTSENAFYGYLTGNTGMIWLTKDGTECSGKDVIYTERSEQPEQSARVWVCPDCKTENGGISAPNAAECALRPAGSAAGSPRTEDLLCTVRNVEAA